ncbi:11323_t:CDS:2 [Racocetra fulgida]|uniref:11323_t:CDS:1 n=1 Tax=Racocetra fulgida TaxID=60492 RepID=A0A9N8VBV0_9GLOM|nr:11323_t:CDS:2 [Racocetra fulgida]
MTTNNFIDCVFLIKQKNDKQSSSSTPSQTPPNNNQNPPSENPENSAEKIKEELKNHLKTENYLDLPDCSCSDDRLVILLRKEGKPVNKKEFSLAGMSEKVKQEIEKLSEQFPFRAEELINKDIAKLDQNPNLLYDGRVTSGQNIFRLFREIAVHQIKVIILGQDPYHLPEVADGLAFSTQKPNYIPASLKNIFLEFSRDLNCVSPTKGDLLPWVKEGVFLLNTALTKAKKIGEECQIGSEYSLASAHPSPYSAEHGFFGSCPFSQVNKLLSELGKKPIDWLSILLPKLKKC